MAEIHLQNQQKPQNQQQQQQQPIIIPLDQTQTQEPTTDLFSMLHLSSHRQPPKNTSTKRRSPPSSSSIQRSAKKLFSDQEDLTNHGFSSIPLPIGLGAFRSNNNRPVLRRCVSDLYNPPENSTPLPVKGSGLPPLPQRFTRCLSDITSSRNKRSSRCLSDENTHDSMRLKRMKDRLREMRQWWDEITKEEEEEGEVEVEEEEEHCPVAEEGKILSQDELGRDSEEAISVEWAEKCVSLTFKCPCSKGYEVLISANNCYYKLL